MTPLLSELREPPVVGRFYMVPVVRGHVAGRLSDWPVLGPRHNDQDTFPHFPWDHYHLDGRFLSPRQANILLDTSWTGSDLAKQVGLWVMPHDPASKRVLPRGRPPVLRRKCQRDALEYAHGDKNPIISLRERFGAVVEPRLLADGRRLCPHRKVDLSSFPPDADGIVVCPLHGLRVRCGVPAHA